MLSCHSEVHREWVLEGNVGCKFTRMKGIRNTPLLHEAELRTSDNFRMVAARGGREHTLLSSIVIHQNPVYQCRGDRSEAYKWSN